MKHNTVICSRGCDKEFIVLDKAGKCVSSEQKKEDKENAELAGNHIK